MDFYLYFLYSSTSLRDKLPMKGLLIYPKPESTTITGTLMWIQMTIPMEQMIQTYNLMNMNIMILRVMPLVNFHWKSKHPPKATKLLQSNQQVGYTNTLKLKEQ